MFDKKAIISTQLSCPIVASYAYRIKLLVLFLPEHQTGGQWLGFTVYARPKNFQNALDCNLFNKEPLKPEETQLNGTDSISRMKALNLYTFLPSTRKSQSTNIYNGNTANNSNILCLFHDDAPSNSAFLTGQHK